MVNCAWTVNKGTTRDVCFCHCCYEKYKDLILITKQLIDFIFQYLLTSIAEILQELILLSRERGK